MIKDRIFNANALFVMQELVHIRPFWQIWSYIALAATVLCDYFTLLFSFLAWMQAVLGMHHINDS